MSSTTLVATKTRRKKTAAKVITSDAAATSVIDRSAAERGRHVKEEMDGQFQRLKDEAHTIFGMVEGRPGVKSRAEWEKLLDRAGDDIGTGRFIVRCLGAEIKPPNRDLRDARWKMGCRRCERL